MENKDFAIAVNKFFYYVNNFNAVEVTYPTLFDGNKTKYLPSFFKAFEPHMVEHLLEKYEYYAETYGNSNAILGLYGELDGENRYRLLSWINENFKQRDTFGIKIPMESVKNC